MFENELLRRTVVERIGEKNKRGQSEIDNKKLWLRTVLFLVLVFTAFLIIYTIEDAIVMVDGILEQMQGGEHEVYVDMERQVVIQKPYLGIWISVEELAQLPMEGPAWEAMKSVADRDPGIPLLRDQDSNNDVYVLAKALVYARTGEEKYRDEVIQNLMRAPTTERGGRTLALGRNLTAYVVAADLINLPENEGQNFLFRVWLRNVRRERLAGRSLISTHEDRPNNWGNHAGAARAAIALYLGDEKDLENTATVFRGFLGDTSSYQEFIYGEDLTWHCDPQNPRGINPKGCKINGQLVDGAMPEEMRRGGSFEWPPVETGYAWEGLQGIVVLAEILDRAGYPAWEWEDQAILRAVDFLYQTGWEPEGDDVWQVWLINRAYGTNYPTTSPARFGKNMGWTDWTHSGQKIPDGQSHTEQNRSSE